MEVKKVKGVSLNVLRLSFSP